MWISLLRFFILRTSPTKVDQYALAHVRFFGTTTTNEYRKAEYVLRRVLSLHENVVISVCARSMDNAAYIIFIMWNFISGLEAWYHFRFNISCGVAVMGRSHQKKIRYLFKARGGGKKKLEVFSIFEVALFFRLSSF